MDKITSFSAKDLCTRSCMQIKLFNDFPEKRPKPNVNTEFGNTFQHEVAKSMSNVVGEEMRGTFRGENFFINFSNDIVCEDKIIECKSVMKDRKLEEWYFNSSLVQCAVYSSLLSKTDRKLTTSTFFINLGNPCLMHTVRTNTPYFLRFGDDFYEIVVDNPDKIVSFITKKAKAACEWNTARQFDEQFKKKEFETLSEYFHTIKRNTHLSE